jgi:hypothetical protein
VFCSPFRATAETLTILASFNRPRSRRPLSAIFAHGAGEPALTVRVEAGKRRSIESDPMTDDRRKATLNLSYTGPGPAAAVEVTHPADVDLTINAAAPPAPRPRWHAFKDGWRIGRERWR